jgi:hypothetical protein
MLIFSTKILDHSVFFIFAKILVVIANFVIDGRITLGGIFRKWEGIVGTGWSGLRIGTGGGNL